MRTGEYQLLTRINRRSQVVGKLIESEQAFRTASLPQIRAMLTYFVRGERFSDGWWGHMIEGGYVRRILERLAEIENEQDERGERSRR